MNQQISTLELTRKASHPLHGLSPYVGRLATHRATTLINQYSKKGGTLADPFCGSGTIPLEAWKLGMQVVASDLSPYAVALTRAKLFPTSTIALALEQIDLLSPFVEKEIKTIDLRGVPKWVRSFYHTETLRETIAWSNVLKRRKAWFLFGCFLNLLHHQRPGFLSYPASHTIPYLRHIKFPRDEFPELYKYRDVRSRLLKKVNRTLEKSLEFDYGLSRVVKLCNAQNLVQAVEGVDCIITSPPYMSGLHYARDNRLRLWFCGVQEWESLEGSLSPCQPAFLRLMDNCARKWQNWLRPKGYLVVVLGDIRRGNKCVDIANLVMSSIESQAKLLEFVSCEAQAIPDEKRLIKGNAGTVIETTLVFRRRKNVN